MKTQVTLIAIIISLHMMMAPAGFARDTKNTGRINLKAVEGVIPDSSWPSGNTGITRLNDVNLKAENDFSKRFSDPENAVWHTAKNAFIVKFMRNNTETFAAYNRKGHWLYTVKRYRENAMPQSVKAIVKPAYYDCIIEGIAEVNTPALENTVYIVYMHNDKTVQIVRVCNGEMELIESYTKG